MGTKIRVNSVHPGKTNTALGRGGVVVAAQLEFNELEQAGIEEVAACSPMGR